MQISDFLVKKCYSSITFCGFLRKKLHFGKSFLWAAWGIPIHAQLMCSVFWTCCKNLFFVMEFLKLFYINFDTYFSYFPHKSVILMPSGFLSLLFLLNSIIPSYFEELHSDTFWFDFINLLELIVDSIDYLG